MDRHYCSTTYLLDDDQPRILLHWHNKLQTYLPPGGHLEPNEAPIEAAKREIIEEYGNVDMKFIHPNSPQIMDDRAKLLPMPHFLIEENIGPDHVHLDWIFFAKFNVDSELKPNKYQWFNIEQLEKEENCFENVRTLGIYAMQKFYS